MPARKYPLDPLARLRAKQVGDAARLLSDAVRVRQAAEQAETEALARRDAAHDHARVVTDEEREALERGDLRGVDLARAAAWSTRVDAERAGLDERASEAAGRARAAEGGEHSAREEVARARADVAVVERNRATWEGAAAKKEEAKEEEAAAEAFEASGAKQR